MGHSAFGQKALWSNIEAFAPSPFTFLSSCRYHLLGYLLSLIFLWHSATLTLWSYTGVISFNIHVTNNWHEQLIRLQKCIKCHNPNALVTSLICNSCEFNFYSVTTRPHIFYHTSRVHYQNVVMYILWILLTQQTPPSDGRSRHPRYSWVWARWPWW